jgi:uncharacterized membrane protein YkoI
MNEKIKGVLAAMAAVAALAVGGAAIAGAAGGRDKSSPQPTAAAAEPATQSVDPAENESDRNDSEAPIGGSALDKASAAALEHTGGQVTETEVGDEESYYEVEVTRDDGSQVDVQLDRGFAVVGAETDGQEDPGE